MKERDRYVKIVEWSDDDRCYVGSVPCWIGKCCHGDDELKVYRELCEILEEWIEIYKKEGRPLPPPTNKNYSGKFVLRAGSELHQVLALKALNEGESLNSFVIKKLKQSVLK
ncbi:MAG: toxin-antitoxin system HicB family antitoxin [Candidatus Aminicenantes bacterium]|nr:toxin-antitoxin system HicB family antitoxin [Candidatus Aminicenantes bacterium]